MRFDALFYVMMRQMGGAVPDQRYSTVHDVADLLKVNEATVRRWIRERQLRAIDIGKGWRIGDGDLADFLDRHETRPPTGGASRQDEARIEGKG
jgi:excisionase family DNA binding protein